MKKIIIGLVLILSITGLSGCGGGETAAATENTQASTQGNDGGQDGGGQPFESAYLNRDYDGALPLQMQLSMGILQLEGTANAITADQAGKLLPLWQGIQGGAFENATERNAVLKQIEATLTAEQMNAIAAMNSHL